MSAMGVNLTGKIRHLFHPLKINIRKRTFRSVGIFEFVTASRYEGRPNPEVCTSQSD